MPDNGTAVDAEPSSTTHNARNNADSLPADLELEIRRFLAKEEFSMRGMVSDYKKFLQFYMVALAIAGGIFATVVGYSVNDHLKSSESRIDDAIRFVDFKATALVTR